MTIKRHKVDLDVCREWFDSERDRLPKFLGYIKNNPSSLSQVATVAEDLIRYGSVVAPDSPDIPRALRICAQANAALFAIDRAGGERVEILLGNEKVILSGPINESILHASRWLSGVWQAMICRESALVESFCQTPTKRLRQSSTTDPEYRYNWIDAVQGFWSGAADTAKRVVVAMEATDPDRADILARDWTLNIDVPAIRLLFYAIARDKEFDNALNEAIELHKQYWTATPKRRKDPNGFLSFELTAMTVLATERNVPFDVQSEYFLRCA